jgi:hypothetical protein
MPPARIFAAVLLTAAVAATGIFIAHATATHPAAATPAVPGVTIPTTSTPTAPMLIAKPPPQPPGRHTPDVAIDQIPAPRPVLADGRYDTLIPHVDIRHDRAVVDLVQVFYGHAAEEAAIADGKNPGTAKGATIWISNHNPRLRTLPLARDLRLDLRDGEFQVSHSDTLNRLATDAFNTWFTLTVAHGVVVEIQEH